MSVARIPKRYFAPDVLVRYLFTLRAPGRSERLRVTQSGWHSLDLRDHGARHRGAAAVRGRGPPRARGVRPRREAGHLRVARPGRRRLRRHAARARRAARRRRLPHARLLDQVRGLLPRGPAGRCDHLGDQRPPRASASRRASSTAPRPRSRCSATASTIPDGVRPPARCSTSPSSEPRSATRPRRRRPARRSPRPTPPASCGRAAPPARRRARSTTTPAWPRSRATWASSPSPATGGSSCCPFAHVGYMTRMWDELANGTTIVIAGEPWSAAETLRLIRDENITMGTGVPTQWELVLAHPDLARTDFSQLRVCGIGGAAISPDLVRRMRETLGCPVITRYTSTEAGVTTSTVIGDADEVIATTVGRPAPEVELRIVARSRPAADAASRDRRGRRDRLPVPRDDARLLAGPGAHRDDRRRRRMAAHRRPRDRRTPTGTSASSAGSRRCTSAAGTTCTRPRSEAVLAEHPGVEQVAVVEPRRSRARRDRGRVRRAGRRGRGTRARRAARLVPGPHRRLQGT